MDANNYLSKEYDILSVDLLKEDIADNDLWPLVVPTSRIVGPDGTLEDMLHPVETSMTHTCYLLPDLTIIAASDMAVAERCVEAIKAKHFVGELRRHDADVPRPNIVPIRHSIETELAQQAGIIPMPDPPKRRHCRST